jgi:hypothetical protein
MPDFNAVFTCLPARDENLPGSGKQNRAEKRNATMVSGISRCECLPKPASEPVQEAEQDPWSDQLIVKNTPSLSHNLLPSFAGACRFNIRNLREETLKGIQGRLRQGLFPFSAPIGYVNNGGGNRFLFQLLLRCNYCKLYLVGERQMGHVYYRCHRKTCPITCIREERVLSARAFSVSVFRETGFMWVRGVSGRIFQP